MKIKAEIINQQKVAKGQSTAKMPVGVRILDADGKVVAEQKNDIHFNANGETESMNCQAFLWKMPSCGRRIHLIYILPR